MKRQTGNVRSMVYQYGSVAARIAPVVGEDAALAQMRLARRLWNTLVAIERMRVLVYRRIMRDQTQDEIEALRARKEALWAEIKQLRQKARKKTPVPAPLADELARIKAALGMLIEHQHSTRDARHGARRTLLEALTRRTSRRIKRARQAAGGMGLYWGTYNAIVQSADTGRKNGGELQFRSFRGEGTVTAQVQGGATPAEAAGGGNRLFQISPPLPGRKWQYARVRIGSHQNLAPLWVAVPIVYHRPLPPDGVIKSVSATRRMVAGEVRWTVNVTLTLPPILPVLPAGAVAIDIGWRILPAGVRVGYWQDEQGAHGEVVVPLRDIAGFSQVRDLRSICDQSRDRFRALLAAWLSRQTLSEPWRDRTRSLSQWRSADRLAALIRWWDGNRLDSDQEIYDAAREWRGQYLHLANWWRNQHEQLTLRVREMYRVFACRLTRQGDPSAPRYAAVVLEDFDMRPVIGQKPENSPSEPAGGNYRQMVNPSGFRLAVIQACRREGLEVLIVPGAYTTSTCHVCRHVENWDHARDLLHRCGACGALWDQDHNAAINLLARGRAARSQDQQLAAGNLGDPGDRSQTTGKEAVLSES